jgi:pimeloyl-ACP methyl ester carboxylesterase
MPTFNKIDDQRKFLSDYQIELKSWSVPAEELDIETEFGKTHIISFGNPQGKPLILLHWFYSNSTEWKYMAPFLQERYHLYAIDIIGDMGKSYAYNPPKSEIEVSQWFNQVLDGLSLNKVSICGHSNGGFQAMLIAQQNPDRVEKLILLAPAAGLKSFSFKFYLSSFGTAIFPKDIILETFKNSGTLKANQWSKEMTEMLTLSFRVAANQLRVYPREFSDVELKAIKVPTLLILGKEEMIYSPAEAAERALRLLPNSKVIILPDCGHAIPFDAPKEASNAIDSFLSAE